MDIFEHTNRFEYILASIVLSSHLAYGEERFFFEKLLPLLSLKLIFVSHIYGACWISNMVEIVCNLGTCKILLTLIAIAKLLPPSRYGISACTYTSLWSVFWSDRSQCTLRPVGMSGFQISFSLFLSFLTEIRKFRKIFKILKIKFKNVGQIQSLAIKMI
jgi:hypothetical protein